MNFTTIFTIGMILLSINIAVILYLLIKNRKEKQRYQACEDCCYWDCGDDFFICRACDNGSNFEEWV